MPKIFVRLVKALNSESNPAQLALGVVAGMFVGLTPLWSLSNLIIALLVFLFRINLSAFFLFWGVFSGIAYLVDPLMDWFGEALLTAGVLEGMWTAMYNSDFWRLARFNNTLTLGGFMTALVLAAPVFFTTRVLVLRYRAHVLTWVRKTRIMQAIMASRFYQLYTRWSSGS